MQHRERTISPALGILALAAALVLTMYASAAHAHSGYGHSPDYSWVMGRLEHSNLEGGFWMIRYQARDDKPDEYGGHFVLRFHGKPPAAMKDGAMVAIHGAVAKDVMGIQMAGTYYNVQRIQWPKVTR